MNGESVIRHVLSIFGVDWPEADAGTCRHAADLYRSLAGHAEDARVTSGNALKEATSDSTSKSLDAFATDLEDYRTRLSAVEKECNSLADALDEYAKNVDEVRHQLIVLGEQIAADLVVTTAFGFVTGGLSDLAGYATAMAFGVDAVADLSGLALTVARIVSTITYYTIDSVAYGAVDQAATVGVNAANGDPVGSWSQNLKQAGQIAVANVAFDGAVDGGFPALNKLRTLAPTRIADHLPADFSTSVPGRAVVRLGASSLAFTPVLHAEQGDSGEDLMPDRKAWAEKVALHMGGRVMVDKVRFKYGLP